MRPFVLSLTLAAALAISSIAMAQDVTASPKGSGSSIFNMFMPHSDSAAPAPAPAPTPAPQQTTATTPSVPLPQLLPRVAAPAPRPGSPIMYVSPDTQKQMIEQEMSNLQSYQRDIDQLTHAQSVMSGFGRTPQEKEGMAQMEQEQIVQMNLRMQESQQRLKLLQSGPLTYKDLTTMYNKY